MLDEQLEWRELASCAKTDKSQEEIDRLFFPDTGISQKEAKAICASCPVSDPCLEFALKNNIEHGIWGGTSERQRRRLRRARRWTA